MVIEIHPPHALHEIGQRSENEDYIYPKRSDVDMPVGSSNNGLFIVCDGVGGAEKGEEASRIVCESFAESLKGLDNVYNHDLERALEMAESRIDAYIESHPEAEGMATTLALVALDKEGVKVAHIGDSRVYHLRDGQMLFRTNDHSLVNEMVSNNIITAEEAVNHPKRNVVLRAIMGSQRPTKMDTALITDVQPGDYFFLCTDGVLESVSDEILLSLLSQSSTDEDKMLDISNLCNQYSKDNFSAYLVRIKSVLKEPKATSGSVEDSRNNYQLIENNEAKSDGVLPKWVAYLLIIFSIATVLMMLFTMLSMG